MSHEDHFRSAYKLATMLSNCMIVPEHYRGKPNDILVALHKSSRMGEDPFELMDGTSVHKGRLDFNGKYAISLAHRRGVLDSAISFSTENTGDNIKVTATAKIGGRVVSAEATLKQALKAGWGARSKEYNLYHQIPEHMLHFRAAKFLLNRHCPEVFSASLKPREKSGSDSDKKVENPCQQ